MNELVGYSCWVKVWRRERKLKGKRREGRMRVRLSVDVG